MSDPVSSIRNLGPASDAAYARAGIHTAEEIRELGADKAYELYLQTGGTAHFIGYYALVMGLQGRPWNDCRGDEKADLRVRFDALKKQIKQNKTPQSSIETDLDALGVGISRLKN
jgi:hypothetical protein